MENSSTHNIIQLQLLEKFPLLLPQNRQFTRYDGLVNIEERQWRLSLDLPNYPSLDGVKIQYSWDMEAVLKDDLKAVDELPQKCGTVVHYLVEFCKILQNCVRRRENRVNNVGRLIPNASDQLKTLISDDLIMSELQTLALHNVSRLGTDLRTVSIVTPDGDGNLHEMTLRISQNYPNKSGADSLLTVLNTDLPKLVCELIQKESCISAACKCFSEQLLNLSTIWKQLQILDSRSWVIDPSHPKKADMYRRIFIDAPKVMAQITWNPLHPLNKPDIMFQGAESEVETFRNIYEARLEEWSQSCDVVVNICKVLNLDELPPRQERTDGVDLMQNTGECCICMSAELEGALPAISCGQCLSCFHVSCLFQWLEMLSKNRVVHHHITGNCPNCEAEIKCPDPNAMDVV